MRILLGAARGLVFLYLICTAGWALACDQLPAGQVLWVRLSGPISTYTAHVGDPVRAVLTQDILCGNELVLPMGTPVEGVVRNKHKVGWGIRHERAALELEFNRAVVGPNKTVEMTARVEEVENVLHHGLELAEDRDRGYEEVRHRTGSWPPWLHGLQRKRRQPASAEPLKSPYLRTA